MKKRKLEDFTADERARFAQMQKALKEYNDEIARGGAVREKHLFTDTAMEELSYYQTLVMKAEIDAVKHTANF